MLFEIVVFSSLELYSFSERIFVQLRRCLCMPHGPSGCEHWGVRRRDACREVVSVGTSVAAARILKGLK